MVVHAAVYDALDLPALLATTRQRFDQLRVQGHRGSLPYLGLDPSPYAVAGWTGSPRANTPALSPTSPPASSNVGSPRTQVSPALLSLQHGVSRARHAAVTPDWLSWRVSRRFHAMSRARHGGVAATSRLAGQAGVVSHGPALRPRGTEPPAAPPATACAGTCRTAAGQRGRRLGVATGMAGQLAGTR